MMLFAFLLSLGVAYSAPPETSFVVRGILLDSADQSGITFARISSTTGDAGTVSESDGSFSIAVDSLPAFLHVFHLGYSSSTFRVDGTNVPIRLFLAPQMIGMKEVVIVGEDPGRRIMRAVIKRITQFKDRTSSYRYRSIQKQTIQIDTILTGIAAVSSFVEGTSSGRRRMIRDWSKLWLSVDSSVTNAAERPPIDLTSDHVTFWNTSVPGLLSPEGVEEYDFVLDSSRSVGNEQYQHITATLKGPIAPGFDAALIVNESDERIVQVALQPNAALSGRFSGLRTARIEQIFSPREDRWFPSIVRTTEMIDLASPIAGFPVLLKTITSIDRKEFGIDTSSWKTPETGLPERLQDDPYVDSAAFVSVPFTAHEREMLLRHDTLRRRRDRVTPDARTLALAFLNPLDRVLLQYNRATGIFVGLSIPYDVVRMRARILPTLAFGTANREWYHDLGFSGKPWERTSMWLTLGHRYMVRTDAASEEMWIPAEITDLLAGRRDREPYREENWYVACDIELNEGKRLPAFGVMVQSGTERSASRSTTWRMFAPEQPLAPSLQIVEGMWQKLAWDIKFPKWEMSFLVSGTRLTRADRRHMIGSVRFADSLALVGDDPAFSPYVSVRGELSAGAGAVPIQRWSSPSARVWFYSSESGFNGMGAKEFAGDRMAAIRVELNARGLPFAAAGLPILSRFGLGLKAHAAIARVEQVNVSGFPPPGTRRSTNGWYAEIGVSVGRILRMIDLDVTRRLTHGSSTLLSGSIHRPF